MTIPDKLYTTYEEGCINSRQEIAKEILKLSEECGAGVLFYHKIRKYAEELLRK